jgi:hypothetical protein
MSKVLCHDDFFCGDTEGVSKVKYIKVIQEMIQMIVHMVDK